MTPIEAAAEILAQPNQFFTVTFTKRDGTPRRMTARRGVRKHITGKGLSFDPADRGLIVVYDVNAPSDRLRSILHPRRHLGNYRMVTIATITSLTIAGTTHQVSRRAAA